MEKRLAIISVIVEDRDAASKVNMVLSLFGDCVVGRMGLPYKERELSIITVVVDADPAVINAVTGKLGAISGVTAKTLMR